MSGAPTRLTVNRAVGTGLFARLRAWFAACQSARALSLPGGSEAGPTVVEVMPASARVRAAQHPGAQHLQARAPGVPVPGATLSNAKLFAFPVRGEALLVRLADQLRQRVGEGACDLFLLALSRYPRSRLIIDCDTYVEFDPKRAAFRLVVDMERETRLTIETPDFDTVVKFVAQYVSDRLADPLAMEAAS